MATQYTFIAEFADDVMLPNDRYVVIFNIEDELIYAYLAAYRVFFAKTSRLTDLYAYHSHTEFFRYREKGRAPDISRTHIGSITEQDVRRACKRVWHLADFMRGLAEGKLVRVQQKHIVPAERK